MTKLIDILDKNFPKYDVAMKVMFVVENSSLRSMLGVPRGTSLPQEFPDFGQTRVDALIQKDDTIFHIEFQARNDSTMPLRMLDYRNSIYKAFPSCKGRGTPHDVVQSVVYVGSPSLSMAACLNGTGLEFRYRLWDIRDFASTWQNHLAASQMPLDWILELMCRGSVEEAKWLNVAKRILSHLSAQHANSHLQLAGVLLVAATLRNLSEHFRRSLLDMFTMNVETDPVLREIYDQANERNSRSLLLRLIESGLRNQGIELDDTQREKLVAWTVDELNRLAEEMVSQAGAEEISAMLPESDGTFRRGIVPRGL